MLVSVNALSEREDWLNVFLMIANEVFMFLCGYGLIFQFYASWCQA